MNLVQSKTSDGIYFKGLISEPAVKSDTIIIHIHGMAGSFYLNNFYKNMHDYYPQNNIAFLATQNRGSNTIEQFPSETGTKTIGNAYEIFEECVLDIQAWVDFAKSIGYTKIWLQGHSLGPSKIVHYMATKNTNDIEGLILISPSEMNGLVHDEIGQKDFDKLYPEAMELVKDGKANELLSNVLWSNVILSAKTFLNFFADHSNAAIFNFKRPELGWEKVESIKIPVLSLTGTKDDGIVPVIDPVVAMKFLETKLINSPRKKTIVLDGAEHSFDGFEDKIVSEVVNFIKPQI